jgi:hypothetical protein
LPCQAIASVLAQADITVAEQSDFFEQERGVPWRAVQFAVNGVHHLAHQILDVAVAMNVAGNPGRGASEKLAFDVRNRKRD